MHTTFTFVLILGLALGSNAWWDAYSTDQDTVEEGGRPLEQCPDEASQLACQNFLSEVMRKMDDQIQIELNASYTYMAMSAYFSRDDVAYRGMAKFFSEAADEERQHAQLFINYVISRGGRPNFAAIQVPNKLEWSGPLEAVQDALSMEHQVNHAILDLHWVAQQKNDPHAQDFLESVFLTEQVDAIKQLSQWTAVLKRLETNPLGLLMFDEEVFEGKR